MLPQRINDVTIDRVFGEIHLFLKAFPGHSWPDRPSEVPLRTVKPLYTPSPKSRGLRYRKSIFLHAIVNMVYIKDCNVQSTRKYKN